MNKFARLSCAIALSILSFVVTGCGSGNDMSQKELDAMKNAPKMTDADRAKVAAGMQQGAAKSQQSQADWAKAHPEEAAKINAERAKMGRPPLGG
ncbi:MAG: hypothetical protein ACAH95_13645 [Fimbriimonas sp.]